MYPLDVLDGAPGGSQQRLDSSGVALTTWQSCTHKAHGIQSSRLSEPDASSGTGTGLGLELVTEALLTEVMADEETLFELQTMLSPIEEGTTGRPTQEPNQGSQGFLPAQTNSGVDAACDGVAQQRVISPTGWMQRQDIGPFGGLASELPVGPSSHVHESPTSLGGGHRWRFVQAYTPRSGASRHYDARAAGAARGSPAHTDRACRLRGVPGCSHAGNSARCEPGGDWHHQGAALRAVTAGAA